MRLTLLAAALIATLASALAAEDAPRERRKAQDIGAAFVDELVANLTALQESNSRQSKQDAACAQSEDRVVNLGYGTYQGYQDSASGLNIWKGLRYAQAPTGSRRWQPPALPCRSCSRVVQQATEFGPICPQAYPAVPGLPFVPGDEDCLFLNVYAPPGAQGLPVLVWIHGGGYGYGDGTQSMAEIVNDNGNSFVAVTVQYRLGAFGFLSSAEVKAKGVPNAGLLDQALAIAWVRTFICQFGGDPSAVTIVGESAGASSVMYHGIALGGAMGQLLFDGGVAASPFLPFHYRYDAEFVTARYQALATATGCAGAGDVFQCLQGVESAVLQQANANVTAAQTYGTWAYYPVTDDAYILGLPSAQLQNGTVNGLRILVGNNANEGPLFTPPTIATEDDLTAWLQLEFPNLSATQIQQILTQNPLGQAPLQETNGRTPPFATAVSADATGQQQRANNIYAEATFVCPSYWLSGAYGRVQGGASYHYQYSVPFAWHTSDVSAYFGPAAPNQGAELVSAFRKAWGGFVTSGDPSVPGVVGPWPQWTAAEHSMVNLNQTGGVLTEVAMQWGVTVPEFEDPGLKSDIEVVDADAWEGDRGKRCEFWLEMAPNIPS